MVPNRKFDILDLKKAYEAHGPRSVEFFNVVKNFVIFLEYRYMGREEEELFWRCYSRLLESMEYYTGDINIASWTYSTVRNQISAYLYSLKKDNALIRDGLDFIIDDRDTRPSIKDEEIATVVRALDYGVTVQISSSNDKAFWEPEEVPLVIRRAVLWERKVGGLA